jgi:hypothetical protein
MASWYDKAAQTSFKPAPEGGYVYRCPNPWLFGHWRSYLVNETEKESLSVHLRQRQRLTLWLFGFYLLVAFGLTIAFGSSGSAVDPTSGGFYVFVALALMGMLALALVPHVYLMLKIAPMVAQLPRAEPPVSLHDQLFGVAAVISYLHLALGGFGGALVVIANVKTMAEYLSEGAPGIQLLWPGFGLVFGSMFAGYFLYLTILKRKLQRKPK